MSKIRISVLLLTALMASAADAQNAATKIAVQSNVQVATGHAADLWAGYYEYDNPRDGMIQQVQATQSDEFGATRPAPTTVLQSQPAEAIPSPPATVNNGFQPGTYPTDYGPNQFAPAQVQPAPPATEIIAAPATEMIGPPPVVAPAGPAEAQAPQLVIPNGCPNCECVVCQCASPTIAANPCGACDPCPPLGNICGASACCPRWWVRSETFLRMIEGDELPDLATTGPITDPTTAGVLGQPGTQTLLGPGDFDDDYRIGGRYTFGVWLDDCRKRGLQGEFWGIPDWNESFNLGSNGDWTLARPFFNTETGAQDAQLIAYPGLATGNLSVTSGGNMWSAAPTWRFNAKCCCACRRGRQIINRIDFLAGYRYWHFEEQFRVVEQLFPQGQFFAPGSFLELTDDIRTRNDFHGGEVGVEWLRQRGRLVLELGSRLAVGNMRRRIDAFGTTRSVVPNASDTTVDGGFYIPASGVRVRDNKFTVIPQVRLGLGYYFRPCLRGHIGYDLFYAPNVVRPSSVLDPVFAGSSLSRGRGTFTGFDETDVVVQGLSIGMTLNY